MKKYPLIFISILVGLTFYSGVFFTAEQRFHSTLDKDAVKFRPVNNDCLKLQTCSASHKIDSPTPLASVAALQETVTIVPGQILVYGIYRSNRVGNKSPPYIVV